MPTTQEDFDLKSWLDEIKKEGSLSDQQYAALEEILKAEKPSAYLKRSVSNHKDWTRKTQELAEQRKATEAQLAEIAQEKETLVTWRDGVQAQLDQAWADLQNANMTAAKYKSTVETIAKRYGLDPKDLAGGELPLDAQPTKGTPAKEVDVSKFLTATDLDERLKKTQTFGSLLQAQIYDLAQEHQALFGKPLPKATELVQEALKAGKSLEDYWADKYKVGERRNEVLREQIRREEHEKVDSELRAKYSEQVLEGGQRALIADSPHSIVFDKFRPEKAPVAPASGNGQVPKHPDSRALRAVSFFNEERAKGTFKEG